jgi:NAD(P)-dependent dehydrogenase (short-subunit alcohol dehydrogenase family)
MVTASFDYSGSVVLVTGGTRGIGRAIADAFARSGATVVVCGRTEPGESTHEFVACDVRDSAQVSALAATIVERHGRVDVLVNNAGGAPLVDSASASPRFNERIVALNLLAPIIVAQAVYPAMAGAGGVIINVSSVSGMRANPNGVAYGAAKAGLINVSETLAAEWGPAIRVVTLSLGLVVTEEAAIYYGDAEGIAAIGRTIPLGRMGEPTDAADACLFIASPLARWLTGANVVLHGGGELPAYLGVTTNAALRS